MLVHLLSAFPLPPIDPENFTAAWLRESAAEDPFGQHQLTEDPAAADLILFVENHPPDDPYALSVRHHAVFRNYPHKSFLYQDADFAVPVIRGVYPSIRRRDHQPERCRSGGYIARISQNDAIRYDPEHCERKWLYSFFGEVNSPVRAALFRGAHPRGLVRDTTGKRLWQMNSGSERAAFTREYAESIQESQFVLCPAGLGPLSYRLFETMEMGRVPVILSDDWVPPPGVPWADFSLHLPEKRVRELESILTDYSPRHEEMGALARRAWEEWFAKPVCFHRLVECCVELKASQPGPLSSLRAWSSLLRPLHIQNWVRPCFNHFRHRLQRPKKSAAT